MHLANLNPGTKAVITDVTASTAGSARLMELGFLPGSAVTVIRRAPFGGPLLCRIRNASIALRQADAGLICVQQESCCAHSDACSSVAQETMSSVVVPVAELAAH